MDHLAEDRGFDLYECAHKPALFLPVQMCPPTLGQRKHLSSY